MRKILRLTWVFCLVSATASAQSFNQPILFANETVIASEHNLNERVEFGNYHYVVVQHPQLKLKGDFYGFETMNYVPKNAAFARVSLAEFENAKNKLEAAGGNVLEIADAWRLSEAMYLNNYPEWAWAGDGQSMVLWLTYWDGLAHLEVLQSLQAQDIEILQEVPNDRRIQVIFDPENIDQLLALGCLQYIEEKYAPGEPENFTARTNHRIDYLQQEVNGGLNYDGSGIMVAHNDAGGITDHIDFKGRFSQNAGGAGSDHGDHTAGTISGAGNRDPYAVGMAPGADMFYREYPANLNNADNVYTTLNARLTSNSFSNGCNQGYTSWSQQLDKDASDNPLMLHVFSAGNNGSSSCANNYGAGIGWGNITGGHKQAKNVVTVGNVTRLDGLAPSSSRGPASDGRIKPDVVAVGTQVYSTTDANGPNSYNSKTGTSMSCPGVTGTLAVLMQAYKDLNNGNEAEGALLKGIIQNTADDLGNAGPDYRFGYGRINARNAFSVIENGSYTMDSVGTGDSVVVNMTIPSNTAQARFFLIWADPQAQPSAARDLVNDLDLEVDYNNTTYQPWVLDPTPNATNLNSLATRNRDSLNNMEQVTLDNPTAGTVSLKVKGFNVPQGDQKFYLIAFYEEDKLEITYPLPGMALATGSSQLIRFDAPHATTHVIDYSTDGGATWNLLQSTFNNSTRTVAWNVPGFTNDQIYLRARSSQDTAITGPITIAPVPSNLQVVASCPDSISLDWGDVNNASGYVIYRLGAKYMDSIAYSDSSYVTVPHSPLGTDWYAVATVVNDTSIGFRSEAIEKQPGVFNCVVPNDLALEAVLAPGNGEIPDCAAGPNVDRPSVLIRNTGSSTYNTITVGYERSGATPNVETINRTVNPGDTIVYYFNNRLTLLNNVNLNYRFWISASPDGNAFNDSLDITVRRVNTGAQIDTLPYYQDFEAFVNCSDNADCGATTCNLTEGWHNSQNFLSDDIDFRTHNGTTFSNGTGPNFDHNPGNSSGKYLYTEASGGCDSAAALLLTPCFDLTGAFRPHATIYYHMNGLDQMGRLAMDVYDGERWHLDIAPPVVGSQGARWEPLTADLSAFSGKTISIRYRAKTGQGFRSDIAIDDFSLVDSSGVGLSENALALGLKVYPNPSNGLFTIESIQELDRESTVQVRDLRGQLIWSAAFEANKGQNRMEIDLRDLSAGVYLIEVQNDNETASLRLIKE